MEREIGWAGKTKSSCCGERYNIGDVHSLLQSWPSFICTICVLYTLHGFEPQDKLIEGSMTTLLHRHDVLEPMDLVARQLRKDVDIGEHRKNGPDTRRMGLLLPLFPDISVSRFWNDVRSFHPYKAAVLKVPISGKHATIVVTTPCSRPSRAMIQSALIH